MLHSCAWMGAAADTLFAWRRTCVGLELVDDRMEGSLIRQRFGGVDVTELQADRFRCRSQGGGQVPG